MSRDKPTPRITLITFPQFKRICKYYKQCSGQCIYPESLLSWKPDRPDCKIRTCPIWQRWLKADKFIYNQVNKS